MSHHVPLILRVFKTLHGRVILPAYETSQKVVQVPRVCWIFEQTSQFLFPDLFREYSGYIYNTNKYPDMFRQ